jgi:5'-nucleotidase
MDGTRPRVLVTNDDGVHAPGIRLLARAARDAGYDVTVAAPREEASGTSAALTAVTDEGRVMFAPVSLPGLDGVPAFAVAASPAYIALLAGLGVFGPVPELVLSGINRGANAGRAILHSGTVGAAVTAAAGGARAMAVSLDVLSPAEASAAGGPGADGRRGVRRGLRPDDHRAERGPGAGQRHRSAGRGVRHPHRGAAPG